MNIQDYYRQIAQKTKEAIEKSIPFESDLAKIYTFTEELLLWHEILKDREESSIIKNIASELQFSSVSLTSGLYRNAFVSLRIVLELSIATVFFSANELEFREWKSCKYDIKWGKLVRRKDEQSDSEGRDILSKRWAEAFFPELEIYIDLYRGKAIETYRDLSQFVHGNSQTWSSEIEISFSEEQFKKWMKNFDQIVEIVSFCFCLRFLKCIESSQREKLRSSLTEFSRKIPEIQNLF
ncbi:MAG: hypothetical protein DCF12_08460 [Snowella sp.]|nr:MAG: hypothetical protein DCF12_08460 [Snowella sp.]